MGLREPGVARREQTPNMPISTVMIQAGLRSPRKTVSLGGLFTLLRMV